MELVKCQVCKEREGILDYAEGTLAFTHGFTIKMCRECLIDIIEKELKKIKANLKEQKTLLRKERKNGD